MNKETWCKEWDMGVTDQQLVEACDLLMKPANCTDTQNPKKDDNLNANTGDQGTFDELFDMVVHEGEKVE